VGKKEKAALKVILDTNILISALLFRGELSRIVDLWKSGSILPVISKETFEELRTLLEYPKFRLTKEEIKMIVEEEILPFFEVTEIAHDVREVCKDPDDDKFISCAIASSASYIVSGDKHLCDVGKYKGVKIIQVSDLLRMLS